MILPRPATFALSMALLLLGSSAIASTHYSHPEFTVNEGSTLNLREAGSNLVMETIEDALRAGGLALLGEEFRLDSSLGYVTEESSEGTIKGKIDLVLPLYNEGEHVIFTQPGLVFWEGLAEEERVDGNLGIVYRTNLANTPIGIDAIGGASLFYDWDFHRVGHSRLGIGADIQSGIFHGAFNYYHPLSGERDGQREGFIERALRGMDLRVALERETIRAGARVGLWRYDGGEDVVDEWRTSVGFDAGVRIFPGVFIEGEWEKHQEDVILDQRLSLGLAFRLSLPGFEGQSYGNGSMSSDLYRIVGREKHVLYEENYEENYGEREVDGKGSGNPSLPTVSLGSNSTSITEGNTATITLTLSETLEKNVPFNLIGGGGADYGTDKDWNLSVDGTDCDIASGTNCQVTIDAGDTSVEVTVEVNTDMVKETSPENFTVSVEIDSGSQSIVQEVNPPSLNFNIPAESPSMVSLSADSASITEGNMATITLTLSDVLGSDATFNLIGNSDSNNVTYGTSNDWNLSVGGTDCSMATQANPCQVTINANDTTAEVIVEANTDSTNEGNETFTVSVGVDSGSTHLVQENPSILTFTILPIQHTIFFSGGRMFPGVASYTIHESTGSSATVTLNISPTPTEPVNIPLLVRTGGYASYGNRVHVSGATLRGTPAENNLLLSVPANPGTITLSITAMEDGNTSRNAAAFQIKDSLPHGTLPPNYKVGSVYEWEVIIEEE